MSGEYWLAKAQSEGTLDVSAGSGMVGGVYLPRRTSQRRVGHVLGLSLDSVATKHPARHYRPFLKRPEHDKARQQPSGTQPANEESDRQREPAQRKQVPVNTVL